MGNVRRPAMHMVVMDSSLLMAKLLMAKLLMAMLLWMAMAAMALLSEDSSQQWMGICSALPCTMCTWLSWPAC